MSSAGSVDSEAGGAAHDGGRDDRSRLRGVGEVGAEGVEDLARDVALEAAHDFALGLAFGGATYDVCAGALAVAQPADSNEVKRPVGLAVTPVVEAVAGRFAGGGGNRTGAAEHREGAFAAEA